VLRLFVSVLRDLFRSRASLEAENCALRHQVAVPTGRLGRRRVRLILARPHVLGRAFQGLARLRTALVIVRPETALRWHREGFRAYLAMEGQAAWWSPSCRPRDARTDRSVASGESVLWGAAHSR